MTSGLRHLGAACLAVLLGLPTTALACDGVSVSNTAELAAALSDGRSAALAPGDYAPLTLTDKRFADVQICSADRARPARLLGMHLQGVSGLHFSDLVFDYRFQAGDTPKKTRPFQIIRSEGVTFDRTLFDGDHAQGVAPHADGFPSGTGLFVRYSSRIQIRNTMFRRWFKALTLRESHDLTVTGAEFHDIRSDGMNLVQVENARVADSHFHDFTRSFEAGDHADMIQLWTTDTQSPSRNVTIENNIFNAGKGDFTQTIFIRNEEVDTGRAGPEMFYENLTIRQNVIVNAQTHGISVGATKGLVIEQNTLIPSVSARAHLTDPNTYTPAIRIDPRAQDVRIGKNLTPRLIGCAPAQHDCTENALLVDRPIDSLYSSANLFIGPLGPAPVPLRNYHYSRSHPIFKSKIGADHLRQ